MAKAQTAQTAANEAKSAVQVAQNLAKDNLSLAQGKLGGINEGSKDKAMVDNIQGLVGQVGVSLSGANTALDSINALYSNTQATIKPIEDIITKIEEEQKTAAQKEAEKQAAQRLAEANELKL